jgi:hypothetical protein
MDVARGTDGMTVVKDHPCPALLIGFSLGAAALAESAASP